MARLHFNPSDEKKELKRPRKYERIALSLILLFQIIIIVILLIKI